MIGYGLNHSFSLRHKMVFVEKNNPSGVIDDRTSSSRRISNRTYTS